MNIKEKMRSALTTQAYVELEQTLINHRLLEGVLSRLLTYVTPEIQTSEGITLYQKIITKARYHLYDAHYSDADTMYREYIQCIATGMVELMNYTITIRKSDRNRLWDCLQSDLTHFKDGCDGYTIEYTPICSKLLLSAKNTLPALFMSNILTRRELTCWGLPPIGMTEIHSFEGVIA